MRKIVDTPIIGVQTMFALCAAGLLCFAPRAHAGPDAALSEHLFDDGNGAFLAGDLPRAAAAYQALVEEGVASVELETNLGAVLLRENKRGEAALHLERALFLDPGDDDARSDLAELRRSNVDRLEGESEDGSADALIRLFAPAPGSAAALVLIGAWALACLFFGLRALSPTTAVKRPLVWIAVVLTWVSGAVSGASAAAYKVALQRAVMIAPSTPAREGPEAHAASTFEVHEGTLVRVDDEQSGFARVRLQNGLVGWVPTDSVERVVTPRWAR